MKLIAGDWKRNSTVIVKRTITGKPRSLILKSGLFSKDKLPINQIEEIEVITEENKASIMAKAGWGIAGCILLGGVGLLAGVMLGGKSKLISIKFKDGRSALLQCKPKEFTEIYAAQF